MVTNNSSDISQIGHYEVTSLISTAGGFGVVYKGRNILSPNEPEVAIKLLRTHLPTEEDKKHFQEEVRIHEKLNHKYILRVVEVGFQNGLPYLITEYAINGSLQTLLKKYLPGPLPMEEALTILSQIGQALYYAHNQEPSIVHCDIKPDNILFNSNREALLADFGIAKALDEAKTKISDSIAGTRPYMAPELFKGIISVKSDQYALACLAYELLTGRQPIIPDSSGELAWAEAHKYKVPIPPTQLNPNVPPAIEQAVLKAMAKERDERHRDISEFLQALGRPLPLTFAPPIIRINSLNIFEKTQAQWLEEGDKHYWNERYNEALEAYKQVIRLDPNSPMAYNRIGEVYKQTQQYWQALASYQQAINLNSQYAYAYLGKGDVYFVQERYVDAITNYEYAISVFNKRDPKERKIYAYSQKGSSLRKLNLLEQALKAFEEIITNFDTSYLDAYYTIADIQKELKRYNDAFKTYEEIIQSFPNPIRAFYEEATLYERSQYYNAAIATYDRLIQQLPVQRLSDIIDAYYNKAALFERRKDYGKAAETYNQLIKQIPTQHFSDIIEAYYKLAALFERLKEYDKVIDTYNLLIQQISAQPLTDIIDVYYKLADFLKKHRRYDKAFEIYDLLIQKEPNLRKSYFDKANLQLLRKRYNEAIETYDLLIQKIPECLDAYINKATILEQHGRYNEALATYKQLEQVAFQQSYKQDLLLSIKSQIDEIEQLVKGRNVKRVLRCLSINPILILLISILIPFLLQSFSVFSVIISVLSSCAIVCNLIALIWYADIKHEYEQDRVDMINIVSSLIIGFGWAGISYTIIPSSVLAIVAFFLSGIGNFIIILMYQSIDVENIALLKRREEIRQHKQTENTEELPRMRLRR